MSRWADNFKEHWNWVFISFISRYFFQELEAYQTSYLISLTTSNFFSIFSIFLFLLVLFQLTPLWIVIYLIWNQWLCLIINVWLLRNSHFQWKKYIWLVNNPLFSVLGYFNLSQSEIIKDLTKIPTSANVSKN